MRPLRFILAAFLLLLSLPGSFAQSTKVRGRVIDESTGDGIPYAGVFFKGSTVGATTDTDGWFALETREDSLSVITVSRMGYLPSEIHFYSKMKVKDAISYSAALRKKDCTKRAEELSERLDLDLNKRVEDLSLGNRKKVGIICAVQHHPDLLILDEPTSGLDPLMQREFFSILKEENDNGATIFFSSHILSEVQAYCRSAAFIKEGKILLSDKVGKLEQTGAKKVTIRGGVTKDDLTGLSGITYTEENREDALGFLYNGDIKKLLTVLSNENVKDLTITEPSLEEIFMHYYES